MPDSEELLVEVLRRLSAVERRAAAMVRIGRVSAVQASPYRVEVNLATDARPVLTGWVPVVIPRAGESLAHSPLSVGEAVLLVSPGGSDAVSFALGSVPTSSVAPPADQADPGTTYYAGDVEIVGDLVVDGSISATGAISAEGDVSAEGNVSAEGDVSADGNVSAGGDVVAGTGARVRLLTHVHNPPLGGPPQRI